MYSETMVVTGVTTGANFYAVPLSLLLELKKYYKHQMHATFEVFVLGDQEELNGPPQQSVFRSTMSHDSSGVFGAFKQL